MPVLVHALFHTTVIDPLVPVGTDAYQISVDIACVLVPAEEVTWVADTPPIVADATVFELADVALHVAIAAKTRFDAAVPKLTEL
jgi:hypothetical protein